MLNIWPISEFPSQTCALLLLSLYSVCHVTIAHRNNSNGTDTRVRVQCNDSDVTDRKQSRVCNDNTVTDISWAIATCDGHTNCWQSKVWKPPQMELPTLNGTRLYMRELYNVTGKEINVFSSKYLWHAGKLYECCYRENCDGQRNTRVAIAKIVTDPGCYLDQRDGLNVAIVTIGTENRV